MGRLEIKNFKSEIRNPSPAPLFPGPPAFRHSSLVTRYSLLALTLLAFFLRAWRLDLQSYWIDEAWTLFFAQLSPVELWQRLNTVEAHPPLYHPSTIWWVMLTGPSEYALRFYSLVFGVLTVPLTYRLGKALAGWRVGLIAAMLVATAPFQIWHSQEARMYTLLTAAATTSMWSFVAWLRYGGRRYWLLTVFGTLWAIAAHYHGVFIIGVQGLFLLLTAQRHWRRYLGWGATLLTVFALYAPWLYFSWDLLRDRTNWVAQTTLLNTYLRSAIAYSVGELVPRPQAIWLMLTFAALYILGLIYAARRPSTGWSSRERLVFLLTFTLAPNLAAWLYGEIKATAYLERYLIPVQIGFLLTVALGVLAVADLRFPKTKQFGIDRIRISPAHWLAGLLLTSLLAINGWVLYHHYFDPAYAKPDWRAAAKTIDAFSLPGDAILLTGDGGEKAFDFYYDGPLPVHFDFNTPVPTPDEARQIIATLAAEHRRLWYVPYGAPIDSLLEPWLAEHTYPAWQQWLPQKRLALYYTGPAPARVEAVNARFADDTSALTLLTVARPAAPVPAGDLLPLTLTWQADAPLPHDDQLSLRLVNARGDIFAQSDWPPLAAVGGTSTWPAGQPLTDQRALWLPVDTPPGDYALQLVLYNPADGVPLGQPVTVPNITVQPADIIVPPENLPIPNPIPHPKSHILHPKLLGYAMPESIQPGQEMWLWLYWQATAPVTAQTLQFRLTDNTGVTVTADVPLAEALGPLEGWQPGQVRRAVYHLPTSPRLSGDRATLTVALPGGIVAELGPLTLQSRPRQFEPPDIAHRLDVALGQPPQLTLLGFDAPAEASPGDSLPVTLYWHAGTEMNNDYTVFVQLLNSAGQVVTQRDQPPLAGAAPTTTWLPGEILTDGYTLALPADLPPGQYRLITGLYDAGGQRLITDSGADFVELGMVTVE